MTTTSYQLVFKRVTCQIRIRSHFHLYHDPGPVGADRMHAQRKLLRDPGHGDPLSQESLSIAFMLSPASDASAIKAEGNSTSRISLSPFRITA
jgi:hypothetical protein